MTDIETAVAKLNDAILTFAEAKHEVRRLSEEVASAKIVIKEMTAIIDAQDATIKRLQAHDDPQPTQCPHCGGHAVGAYGEEGYLPLRRHPE
jgi:hypothetical protein